MAAKKGKEAPAEKIVLFGRPGNNMKMGIVGLPNVGKSTLFNLLGKAQAEAANYPFCTIDPNEGKVDVPDRRFDWLRDHFKPSSNVRAKLTVFDIAGLVKGASTGAGLGNAFLSHIRAVDGIYHVVRCFEDVEVTHVEDTVDPVRDLDIITEELRLKDIEFVKAALPKLKVQAERVDKTKKVDVEICEKVLQLLNDNQNLRTQTTWNAKEIEFINSLQLLTTKPVVYLVNLSEKDFIAKKNKWLGKVAEWVKNHGGEPIIPVSGVFESKLKDMAAEERKAFLATLPPNTTSSLPKIIRTGYHHLDLVHFFTVGQDEVRAWTVRRHSKAPQAAGQIHTDFEKGFICAEVTPYEDFKEAGTETAAKAAGKTRTQGKEYIVQDGDIMFFKFNVAKSGKAAK